MIKPNEPSRLEAVMGEDGIPYVVLMKNFRPADAPRLIGCIIVAVADQYGIQLRDLAHQVMAYIRKVRLARRVLYGTENLEPERKPGIFEVVTR